MLLFLGNTNLSFYPYDVSFFLPYERMHKVQKHQIDTRTMYECLCVCVCVCCLWGSHHTIDSQVDLYVCKRTNKFVYNVRLDWAIILCVSYTQSSEFDSLVLSVVSAINHDSSLSRMISYFKRKFRRGWIAWLVFYSDRTPHACPLMPHIIRCRGVNSNQLFFAPFLVGGLICVQGRRN